MKKMRQIGAIAAGLVLASSAIALDKPKQWVGVSAQYYKSDSDSLFDNGFAMGGETGFNFDDHWGMRIDYSALFIDSRIPSKADNGVMFGIDVLRYLGDSGIYALTGLKANTGVESGVFNLGIGKHWYLTERTQLATEVIRYRNWNEGITDYGIKLGVNYLLGEIKGNDNSLSNKRDTDQDGVVDSRDNCPSSTIGRPVDSFGCEVSSKTASFIDIDRDGIADDLDKCPQTPPSHRVDSTGCSVMTEKSDEIALLVNFAHNSAIIENPTAKSILEFVNFMKRYPEVKAELQGHTSALGSAKYNLDLSKRRAEALKELLIGTYGISELRLNVVGLGETQLLDSSNSQSAHEVNRRIVSKIKVTRQEPLTK